MADTHDDRSLRSDSGNEDTWELAFDPGDEKPARRRFSEAERDVLTQLIHDVPRSYTA
jgi:hypothetical protein